MTHEDAGHYAAKHGPGVKADSKIIDAIKEKMSDGKISCAAMHGISKMLSVSPAEAGKTADLLEVRLLKCQLGLFGYSRSMGEVQLPRAISFTAALYSLGVPPELLGLSAARSYTRNRPPREHNLFPGRNAMGVLQFLEYPRFQFGSQELQLQLQ